MKEEAQQAIQDMAEMKIARDNEASTFNIYQRMHYAQSLFKYVQKEQGGGLRYAVVTHDAVTALSRAALMRARVLAVPTVEEHGQVENQTWARVRMDFTNIDTPEDKFSVTMFGYGNDNQDKGPGKAISYAVKYCYLKAFGAETGQESESEYQEVDTIQPVTRKDLLAKLGEAVKENDLDRTFVNAEIIRMHGNVTEIDLDTLDGIVSHIEGSPDMWVDNTDSKE